MRTSKHLIAALSLVCSQAMAQETQPLLSVELNAQETTEAGCLLSFMVRNGHAQEIENVVFETVLFNTAGQVDRLTLLDFGSFPPNRPRVRQFLVDGLACDALGQVLINGANSCKVAGTDSPICDNSLGLSSRTGTELTG